MTVHADKLQGERCSTIAHTNPSKHDTHVYVHVHLHVHVQNSTCTCTCMAGIFVWWAIPYTDTIFK